MGAAEFGEDGSAGERMVEDGIVEVDEKKAGAFGRHTGIDRPAGKSSPSEGGRTGELHRLFIRVLSY